MANESILPVTADNSDLDAYYNKLDLLKDDYPTETFKINFETNQIEGKCNSLEAMKQAFYLQLNTQRYANKAFSNNFGMEWQDLIGNTEDFIVSEIVKRLKDMILGDKRYTDVSLDSDSPFEINGDLIIINIIVTTIYGEFTAEIGVNNG